MAYLSLTRDILIFADSERISGVVIDGQTSGSPLLLSAGFVALLMRAFGDQPVTPDTESFIHSRDKTDEFEFRSDDPKECLDELSAVIDSTDFLGLASESQKISSPTSVDYESDGSVLVNDVEVYRPAGTLITRKVGHHVLYWLFDERRFDEEVRPIREISSSRFTPAGFELVPSTAAPSCATCIHCLPGCTPCPIVATKAVVAVSAALVSSVAEFAFDPQQQLQPIDLTTQPHPEFQSIIDDLEEFSRHLHSVAEGKPADE